jgi:hypothetical protein
MRLLELFEQSGKTVAVAFGRMNPPTIGHQKVVDAILKQKADAHFLFVSQTHKSTGKNQTRYENPLPFDVKLGFIQQAFPNIDIGDTSVSTAIGILQYLEKQGFENVIFVCGSDRVPSFTELFNKQNGIDYNLKSIKIVSSGARDPDAEGAEGMSASKMRAAAIADDLELFKTGLPAGLQGDAEEVFSAIRHGLAPWIEEKIADEGFMTFLKGEPPKKKWDSARDSRVVSNRKDDDAWIKLLLDKHRRGIELTDREWDSIKQWKLKRDMREAEGDAEGLPHLTKELLTHIVDEVGAEGAHAIIKSLTWGDGASKEFLHLIVKDLEQNIDNMDEHIVKVKGGYELKSKHGNKNLGKYPTKAGAEKRERQVQYFKHAGK